MTLQTDANNHTHTTVTDILGRTLSVTPPTGPAVAFTYDPLGNMLTATRGNATMSLTYDKAGRKLTMADPDMGFWQYSYDALGNMTRQEDAKNQVTCLYYDALNRPRGKDYFTNSAACPSDPGSGYDVAYGYDAGTNGKGRRTSMTDASGSTSWLYDSRGRMTKETKVISGTSFDTEWTYNLADLPVTMKYPDGEIVTTQYNNNLLPTSVSGAGNYVPSMTYDIAGRLLTRALGNGLNQTYAYYPWNQQGGRLHTLTTGALQNLTYQYDSVGNITQIADSVAGETSVYDYDALDRLTSWQLNQNSPETYTYDAQGNLDVKNGMELNYNDAAHKHAVTHIGSTQKYWYDDNGNQITRILGADTFNLIYDAENHLVEVKKNSVTISQFTYDGDGARVKSVIDGETIRFVGGYYERKGSQITKYYMAGAARVAMRKYTIPQSMTVEYMLGDHLGSTSITTDSNGAMISEMRYKPWGELRYMWTNAPAETSPTYELTRYQYTGQYSYDAEFGLKYYGARFYDSAVGRFVQPDTIIPQGQGTQAYDRFAYTNNDPVRYKDSSGHCAEESLECRDMLYATLSIPRTTVLQVDLATHTPIKQYDMQVNGEQGIMACGIAAGCGGGASWDEMSAAAIANGYDSEMGMQPSEAANAYKAVYGSENVVEHTAWTLEGIYDSISSGKTVIVDILVTDTGGYHPSAENSFSHFARVLGIDWDNQRIYLENTLPGANFWDLSFEEFLAVWFNPEQEADRIPDGVEPEEETHWGVEIE
jgi:RHS repeat-associated protein